jgi:hypothetical protein
MAKTTEMAASRTLGNRLFADLSFAGNSTWTEDNMLEACRRYQAMLDERQAKRDSGEGGSGEAEAGALHVLQRVSFGRAHHGRRHCLAHLLSVRR